MPDEPLAAGRDAGDGRESSCCARLRSVGPAERACAQKGDGEIADAYGRVVEIWRTPRRDVELEGSAAGAVVIAWRCDGGGTGLDEAERCLHGPPCAARYRQDAYHLITAGLRGGKGVPDTVAEHPAVFVTLTAPSFGAVHTRPLSPDGRPRRCRPRHDAPVCEHGVRISCGTVHADDDPCLGEPLCPDCFDHQGAVVWNNAISELWRRTTIYLPRTLAWLTDRTQKRMRQLVRVSYVKVAEYQRRGLVHLHVLIRLDRAMPRYRAHELHPPARRFDGELLERAIRATVAAVSAPLADELGGGRVCWGDELDIRQLDDGQIRGEIAGYLAKYATKSTEQAGGVVYRVGEHQLDELPVRDHVRAYMREAFALASEPELGERRFGAYAHTLGYRGHCLTKSRRYSTTFRALREAREAYVQEQLLARSRDESQRAIAAAGRERRHASFAFAGRGHLTAADAFLAASAAARAREERRAAQEALAVTSSDRREL